MTLKMKWFEEILDEDPSSKVFFSFAKLLFESGDIKKALEILRQGLKYHPEFLEARLFLIHLLYSIGDIETCKSEQVLITNLFNQYPDFLAGWGESPDVESGSDFSLCMGLISALALYPDLTLKEFLSYGLREIFQRKREELSHDSHTRQCLSAIGDKIDSPLTALEASENSASSISSLNISSEVIGILGEEGDSVSYNVCTRSMAEIFVDQGDIISAIKIYQKLESQAIEDEERIFLHARIVELNDMLSQLKSTSTFRPSSTISHTVNPKSEAIAMLEALVIRLEKRAKV